MYIIAGLGNPGIEYQDTRHNTGFHVVDYFAYKNNIKISKKKFKGMCGEGAIDGEKVLLLKPETYMNSSGESIVDAVNFYNIQLSNLIVVYDDVNLPVGRIRLRPSGSDGGHNGMKSIIYQLGSCGFPRVRVGIGMNRGDLINHVLGRFDDYEAKIINDVVKVAAEGIEYIIRYGIDKAMNTYNSYKHESLMQDE
ncbi:MAG: aminoacyl-tRNA hydrolase [Clostridiales bacterium]|nr:aminoacyl-tRNA hydrolase [Clostridiales bacterium]